MKPARQSSPLSTAISPGSVDRQQDASFSHVGASLSPGVAAAGKSTADQELGHNLKVDLRLMAYLGRLASALAPLPTCRNVEDEWVKVDYGPPERTANIDEESFDSPWSSLNTRTK